MWGIVLPEYEVSYCQIVMYCTDRMWGIVQPECEVSYCQNMMYCTDRMWGILQPECEVYYCQNVRYRTVRMWSFVLPEWEVMYPQNVRYCNARMWAIVLPEFEVFYYQSRHKFLIQKDKTWKHLDVDGMDSVKNVWLFRLVCLFTSWFGVVRIRIKDAQNNKQLWRLNFVYILSFDNSALYHPHSSTFTWKR